MLISEDIQRAITNRESEAGIAALARQCGMTPMFLDGLRKILNGETSIEEVLRMARV
jgi:type II secretory ATPase GspE/PulE/Tfp pilus assembly ATPase PilB-like protein